MIPAIRAIALTFLIMFIVPFPFYAAFEAMGLAQMPQTSTPALFILSVAVIKLGVATGFVLLLSVTLDAWKGRLITYAAIWWVMYAVVEVGQAIAPDYGWGEAQAGILSEAVYFPLSAWVSARSLRRPAAVAPPQEPGGPEGGIT